MHIAIDVGRTDINIGLVYNGTVILKTRLPALSKEGLLRRLSDIIGAIYKLFSDSRFSLSECTGIGIAVPGVVDATSRTLASINDKYSDAVGFPFEEWFNGVFGLPCILENDARAALIGEAAYGVARGETDAVLMTIGTSIGTAAMMDGQIIRGRHHQAGILSDYFVADLEAVTNNDAVGIDTFKKLIPYWSTCIVNLIHAFDPEIVILSGELMKSQADIVPLLQEQVLKNAWTPWGNVRFVVAEDPDSSVLLGVSRLVEMEHSHRLRNFG
ncbi:ROK family protein [Paenibacillus aceris]|uniref:Glucokinase n=1 Tax=Paenibacillus aceris TaxID=869555 RepID=A0ABS4HVM0_9BACL|nr:ROK family protein [Paenibacillus aceris]MBP1962271.1 glucokinase [Paenibacillus aceris]NHW37099.1 ROK family protein [Paenibacillus aceris]